MWKRAVGPLGTVVLVLSSCGGSDGSSGGSAGASAQAGTSTGGAAETGSSGSPSSGNGGAVAGAGKGASGAGVEAGAGMCGDCTSGSGTGASGGAPATAILSDNCLKCIQVSGGAVVNACFTEAECADCMRGVDCANASADVKKRWGDACAAMRSSCSAQCLLDNPKPVCPARPLSQ
jgi:hypothetical protein